MGPCGTKEKMTSREESGGWLSMGGHSLASMLEGSSIVGRQCGVTGTSARGRNGGRDGRLIT